MMFLFLSINITHFVEIFIWMLGSFLIGLFFGRTYKKLPKNKFKPKTQKKDPSYLIDNTKKIRAKQTFARGGKEVVKKIPIDSHTKGLNFKRIGVATFEQRDNLKNINGIGKSIEEKLNAIGIFTFEQISNFNTNDIAKTTELIKFFPGRIERDDWVGQAFKLLNQNKT